MHPRWRHSAVYRRASHISRFWMCVQKNHDGCWIWLGVPNAGGYGTLKIGPWTVLAHRFSYEMMVGKILEGEQLDHLCRVRCCVNPAHLEPVTSRENSLRGNTLAAHEASQTHCIYGHILDGRNLRISSSGKRVCRECNIQRCRLWRSETFGVEANQYAPSAQS